MNKKSITPHWVLKFLNRSGVAGDVLHTPVSLTDSSSHPLVSIDFTWTHRICMDTQNLHGRTEFAWTNGSCMDAALKLDKVVPRLVFVGSPCQSLYMGLFCMTVKWPNPGLFYSDLGRLL